MIPIRVHQLCRGLLAGTIATMPMTLVMQLLHRWPYPERDSLPPDQITSQIASQIGVKRHLDQGQMQMMTIVTHYGFGALAGGLYALCTSRIHAHPVGKGIIWGSLVWSLSYLGWLPTSHILPPVTEHSKRRNCLMIVSHFVWGVATALLAEWGQFKEKS